MADREFKIKFSVDDANFAQGTDKVSKQVGKMYADFVQFAKQYGTSSKDMMKIVEEQVISHQRKLTQDLKASLMIEKNLLQSGQQTPQQYKKNVAGIQGEFAASGMEANILREFFERDKTNNKEKIYQERLEKNDERAKQRIDRQEDKSENEKDSQQKEKDKQYNDRFLRTIGDLQNTTLTVMRAPNIYSGAASAIPTMTSMFTGNPLINVAAALISGSAEQVFKNSSELQQAQAEYYGVTGGMRNTGMTPVEDIGYSYLNKKGKKVPGRRRSLDLSTSNAEGARQDNLNTMGGMGMTYTESYQLAKEYSKAAGHDDPIMRGALKTAELIHGGGIDQGQALEMTKLLRGSGVSAAAVAGRLQSGSGMGNDRSQLSEYMQIMINLSQKQLEETTHVNQGVNTHMIKAIKDSVGISNPVVLGQAVQGLYSGLNQSGNSQVQALQFGVLSSMMPGQSLFQYRKIMEDPFSPANQQYLPDMLKTMKGIAGGGDRYSDMISQVFFGGKELDLSERIAKSSPNKFISILSGAEGGVDFLGEAAVGKGTSKYKRLNAQMSNAWSTPGIIDSIVTKLDQHFNTAEGTYEKTEENQVKAIQNQMEMKEYLRIIAGSKKAYDVTDPSTYLTVVVPDQKKVNALNSKKLFDPKKPFKITF